jgi:NAD(P)-dependent dehydrogenase (short-subunit alcohol dehydrogenase family)
MSYLDDLFSLDGKVAVAIGAGGVLAGAMADALGGAGARVAVLDLNGEAADKRADAIRKAARVETLGMAIDATSQKDLREALGQVLSLWGRVDILLNAPGINSGTPFFEITEEEWDRILAVNLKSMFLACQIFGQEMVDRGDGGSVINISSASSGPPLSKVFTYSITKAGVNNLTQFLAREWAPHSVRVNAVAPGFFPAEQNRKLLTEERTAAIMGHTPMARFGEADELAGAVVWLASANASSFVTGAVIRVDGGFAAMTI